MLKNMKIAKRQWILILYLPIHLLWYMIVETMGFQEFTLIHCALDDIIPFCSLFVFPYVLWFPYMVISGLYFLRYDAEAFENYILSLFIGFIISMLIITFYPTGVELRLSDFQVSSFSTWVLGFIYSVDNNMCVFPSMHIVGAVAVAVSVAKSKSLRKKTILQLCNWTLFTLIVLSTMFIKQHSVLDVIAGIALELIVLFIVYKGWISQWLDKITKSRINEDNEIVSI